MVLKWLGSDSVYFFSVSERVSLNLKIIPTHISTNHLSLFILVEFSLCYALFSTSSIGVVQPCMFEPEISSQEQEAKLYKITCKWKYQNGNYYGFQQYWKGTTHQPRAAVSGVP